LFSILPPAWQSFLISSPGLQTVKPVLLVCLACAMLGLRPYRLWAIASVGMLLVFDMVYKGYAFWFWHGQFALIYCAGLLAIAPCADAYGLALRRGRSGSTETAYRVVPLLIGIALTACYALLGIRRIVEGGVAIYLDDSMLDFTAVRTFEPAFFSFQMGFWPLYSPTLAFFLKVGFAVVTIFEALAPLAVISSRFRFIWLGVMVLFHVSALFTMNIWFWENILLLLLFFTPFAYRLGQTPRGHHPVVFFDGCCALCDASVRWLAKRDSRGILRFAPLAGETAKRNGLSAANGAGTMYLQDEQGLHCRSTAALRSLLSVGGVWAVLGSLLLSVPRPMRDSVYQIVAKNRYAWFGQCPLDKRFPGSENILP
jgi:predicted DCC family thiol-disulfide oxidoreductase YuxK